MILIDTIIATGKVTHKSSLRDKSHARQKY